MIELLTKLLSTNEIDSALLLRDRRRGGIGSNNLLLSKLSKNNQLATPYKLLSQKNKQNERLGEGSIFITGRFRSGTTALWDTFRQTKGCRAYYEPFNERRFFDIESRGNHVDTTHRDIKNYWDEYDGLADLHNLYDENWIRHHLYMEPGFWAPRMRNYIEMMIAHSEVRSVLQFNRIDFRLPWVKANWPAAKIVHLYRNPRDQWCSTLGGLEEFTKDSDPKDFPDRFYLKMWIADLRRVFPILDDRFDSPATSPVHPYESFYLLWKLSWLFGTGYADKSISYETLTTEPLLTLTALFQELELPKHDLPQIATRLTPSSVDRWRYFADEDWFLEHEVRCEQKLDLFISHLTP